MIEAMTDAGVYSGFARADARDIVIRNMIGAATDLSMTGEHPAVKVDQMTSPGGTTIEALKVLQQEGFANAIMTSVDACRYLCEYTSEIYCCYIFHIPPPGHSPGLFRVVLFVKNLPFYDIHCRLLLSSYICCLITVFLKIPGGDYDTMVVLSMQAFENTTD